MKYGKGLILDLHECVVGIDVDLQLFCQELCGILNMKYEDYHEWRFKDPNNETYGVFAIQQIITSIISVHITPDENTVYLNVFSSKDFDVDIVTKFCETFFKADTVHRTEVCRT